MKRLLPAIAILATCAALDAEAAAGDNPPPGLLAKIQIATQAHQEAGREFKDMKKFARENEQAPDGGQRLQFEIQTMTSDLQNAETVRSGKEARMRRAPNAPQAAAAPGTLIGGAIGGHANDGDE
jgi:hypothetical protein